MPFHAPNHSRRWDYDLGNTVAYGGTAIATNRALWRAIVAGLLAIPGVSVYRSCDAVAAGADGDGVNRWDADADLVWANAGTAHSWIVLQVPLYAASTDAAPFLIIDMVGASASGSTGRMWVTDGDGGFVGGTTLARPTTTNEVEIGIGTTLLPTAPTSGYAWHLWWSPNDLDEVTGTGSIRVAIVDVAAGHHIGMLMLEHLDDLVGIHDDAPACGYVYATGAHVFASISHTAQQILAQDRASTPTPLLGVAHYVDGSTVENSSPGQDALGRRWYYPVGLFDVDLCAFVPDLWVVNGAAQLTLSPPTALGAQSRAWMTIGALALPHPPNSNLIGSVDEEESVAWVQSSQGVVTAMDPADGASLGASRDAARWAPISVEISVAAGAVPLVWGYFGADPAIRHVIYDGAAFAPLFEDRSTATNVGGTWTLVLMPLGGWFDSPTIRAGSWVEAEN